MQELFGPIAFVIPTENTTHSIALARKGALEHGALTLSVYSTNESVLKEVNQIAAEVGVALSCNLTGGVYVNQSAAFSDFHGTGANPSGNACLSDLAFVANRFRVVQSRIPAAAAEVLPGLAHKERVLAERLVHRITSIASKMRARLAGA